MNIGFPSVSTALLQRNLNAPQPDAGTGETFEQTLASATSGTSSEADKLKSAAKQFEALMVGEVLKAARSSSDGGWLGTGDDQSGQLAMELGEQQLAQALASTGGLGIARMVTKSLQAKTASSDSPSPAQVHPLSMDSKL
jgi:Rod binding domain-containing protein